MHRILGLYMAAFSYQVGKRARPFTLAVVTVGILALLGWLILKDRPSDQGNSDSAPYQEPTVVDQAPVEVASVAELSDSRVIFSERTVTAVDDGGQNHYHTKIVAVDRTGAKRATVFESDALAYETMAMLGSDRVAIFSESEESARLIPLSGQDEASSIPTHRYLGWLSSADGELVAFSEANETEEGSGNDQLFLWSRASGERRQIPIEPQLSASGEPLPFLVPLTFTRDNAELYVEARDSLDEAFSGQALMRANLETGEITQLFSQSLEDATRRRFIALAPEFDLALFARESLDSDQAEGSSDALEIEQFSLSTKEFQPWFVGEKLLLPSPSLTSPLSPDGRMLILESSDPDRPGLFKVARESGSLTRLTEVGAFLGWTPDSRSVLLEEVRLGGTEESGQYRVDVLDLEEQKLRTLFQQPNSSEGSGLNKVGDQFFGVIGFSG